VSVDCIGVSILAAREGKKTLAVSVGKASSAMWRNVVYVALTDGACGVGAAFVPHSPKRGSSHIEPTTSVRNASY
jgi:hypothetical protein